VRYKAHEQTKTKHMNTEPNKKATAKEKKSFCRRFSAERWLELCNNDEFASAFEDGNLELAAIIASR
jgi:hypothetical protein